MNRQAQFLLCCCFILLILIASTRNTPVKEFAKFEERKDLIKRTRAVHYSYHECIFEIKLKNLDELHTALLDVSLPDSPNYGKHWTRQELGERTSNPAATQATVEFLKSKQIEIVRVSKFGEQIVANALISTWEDMFQTEFYHFDRLDIKGETLSPIARALSYSLPDELEEYVEHVFNTVQLPPNSVTPFVHSLASNTASYVNPAFLHSYYNVYKNSSKLASQLVYARSNQNYSPLDLTLFQFFFSLASDKIETVVNGHNSSALCLTTPEDCVEADLDVQYMLAMAPDIPTTFYYDSSPDFLTTWAQYMLDLDDPPLVSSISYGAEESQFTGSTISSFDTKLQMMGVLGLTVLVGSGDDGVGGSGARDNSAGCGYNPLWPATSPYVLSIGATQGPESNEPEIACSSSTGGIITTGGGFSNLYSRPSWQDTAVEGYLASVSGTSQAPVSGYNTTGRGYPDIAVMGYSYYTIVGGEGMLQSGTSASTPVFAGMVSLVNSGRLELNRSAVGWITPIMYSNYSIFAKDITSGNNKCAAGNDVSTVTCCTQGFYAATGWDPLTGFGSIDFNLFYGYMLSINGYEYTPAPSHAPTSQPTSHPTAPTPFPTRRPTAFPTSRAPTREPTWRPTLATPAPTTGIASKSGSLDVTTIAIIVGAVAGGILIIFAICYFWNFDASKDNSSYNSESSYNSADEEDEGFDYFIDEEFPVIPEDTDPYKAEHLYDYDDADFGDVQLTTYSYLPDHGEDEDDFEQALKESELMNSDFYKGDYGEAEDEIKSKFAVGRNLDAIPDEDEDAVHAELFSADAVEFGEDHKSEDGDEHGDDDDESQSSYSSDGSGSGSGSSYSASGSEHS